MWKDATGREWSTRITVNTISHVKETSGVLLTDLVDGNLFEQLSSDIILLCSVICRICEPQWTQREMTASDFGELLVGDAIDEAYRSFVEDLIAFFPKGRREVAAKIAKATRTFEAEKYKLIETRMDNGMVEKLLKQAVEKANAEIDLIMAAGEPSGKSPGS